MIMKLGAAKQVFVDWDLIEPGYGVAWGGEKPQPWEVPAGIRLAVHPPRIDETPLVWPDRPWESFINAYTTLFEDDGRYRLYYECYHYPSVQSEGDDLKAMLAYAESTDGVNWVKPTIGTVSVDGSTENNLVFGRELSRGRGAHGASVFKDPSAAPAERYKLVHMGKENGQLCVFGAVSPDGLIWTSLEKPLIVGFMSDTQTVMAYDAEKGRYVGYFRGWSGLEHGKWHGRRAIAYAESDTFESWPIPQNIVTPDVHDDPDTDIYTNAYTRWPDAENAHLMFPALYKRTADLCEVHLMTSRNGQNWQRPSRKPIVGRGEPNSGWEGGVYAGCGLITTPAGEWALPLGPKWHTHNQGHFPEGRPANPPNRGYTCLAVWRKDGFMSLEASVEGKCTTVPFVMDGGTLQINAWTQFGGEIRFELAKATGEPLPGFTFEENDALSGDAPAHIVTWCGQSDLSALAGEELRMRLRMTRARLYAFQFV